MGQGPAHVRTRRLAAITAATVTGIGVIIGATVTGASALVSGQRHAQAGAATPIQHLVVIFDENVSFDHYFGTYPYAANTDGQPFYPASGTPQVHGLYSKIVTTPKVKKKSFAGIYGQLLTNNPNSAPPRRLQYDQALTCDQDHDYLPEQKAADGGRNDLFVQNTDSGNCGTPGLFYTPGLVMDYYDGNTVTALWNYAQHYAMSDENFDTTFGPSTPGALNLISGDTSGAYAVDPKTGARVAAPGAISATSGTVYGDLDPAYDDCSDASHTSSDPLGVVTGKNIGDLLNAANITWGWFQGGFAPTGTNSAGYAVCGSAHTNIGGATVQDYSPHHDPFQYYKSTSNPKHLAPSSEAAIGHSDQANHQYDLSQFFLTLKDGNMPAVSFLKADKYQDGHAGYSDPIDEQHFLVNTINAIEKSPFWSSTAIVVTYDDSDGWYDHVPPVIVNGSGSTEDASVCAKNIGALGPATHRCGYGPRLPLLVISPYAPANYVSSNVTDTTSILRFIEDNWLGGQRISPRSYDTIAGSLTAPQGLLDFTHPPHPAPVLLDPSTGR